jgi:hypothetical protein
VKIFRTLTAFALIANLNAALLANQPALQNRTLVQIGNKTITEKQVTSAMQRLSLQSPDVAPEELMVPALRQEVFSALFEHAGKKLELPLEQIDSILDQHIEKEIARAGTLQKFLSGLEARLSISSIEEYRDYARKDFIRGEVTKIITGITPSSNKGFRAITEPTPGQIRTAYKENIKYRETAAVLKWHYLRFLPKPNKLGTQAERINALKTKLLSKNYNLKEILKLADTSVQREGYSESSAEWVKEFLNTAKKGDILVRPADTNSIIPVIFVDEYLPAKKYSFSEAQIFIKKDLRATAINTAIMEYCMEIAKDLYIWATPEIPGLNNALESLLGRDIDSEPIEEL